MAKKRSLSYDTKERFNNYWHQIDEITKLEPDSILEVGIWNSFVSDYLEKHGYDLITLDVKKDIEPDVVADVRKLPFGEESFEMIVACEVLEHIPFDEFGKVLSQFYRIAGSYVIISVPDVRFYIKFNHELIKFFDLKKVINLPINEFLFKTGAYRLLDGIETPNSKHHEWEIGRKSYPLEMIKSKIKEQGFKIKKDYRVFESPYHHIFVLEK